MERKRRYSRVLLSVLLFYLQSTAALGEILVIYPEAPSPYREVFEQIMTGLARTAGEPLRRRAITAATTPADLQSWQETKPDPSAVVLLGQPALDLYARTRLEPRRAVFAGGVFGWPDDRRWTGVSLVVDPALSVRTLKELKPDLRKIVVYHDARDRPWVAEVEKAAGAGLRVEAVAVKDAAEVARNLAETFRTLDPETTALWFGRDTLALDPEALYPYVLKQSWYRRIAVVADAIAYVRRGFLFAYYPNYTEVGAELGELVHQKPAGPNAGFRLTRAGQLTLNTRTARNLGLDVPLPVIQRAKPLFPEP